MTTQRFRYSRAVVARPDGSTRNALSAVLVDQTLTVSDSDSSETIDVAAAVRLGRRQGWSITAVNGDVWLVRREGGCGCGR